MLKGIVVLAMVLAAACTEQKTALEPRYYAVSPDFKKVIRFAVHPLHNPDRLTAVFGPLVNYLNRQIPGLNMQLEASLNYAAFEEKIKKRELEFALPNPYQTLLSLKSGYRIFAKMGDDQNFRGIIIVRRDSEIKNIQDLKGKSISYPAPTALAGSMMPQFFLYKNGLNVLKETKSIYVGTQESSIMNVYLKNTQAGGTWPPPWLAFKENNPEKAKELEVRWETKPLLNNGVIVRDDVSGVLAEKVQTILLSLPKTEEGRKILKLIGVSQFEVATEKTYEPVREFLKEYTRSLRNPETDSAKDAL